MDEVEVPPQDEAVAGEGRVARRAELTEEERRAGSDDPRTQARVILEDSEQRTLDRAAPGAVTEHRRAEDTVDPT